MSYTQVTTYLCSAMRNAVVFLGAGGHATLVLFFFDLFLLPVDPVSSDGTIRAASRSCWICERTRSSSFFSLAARSSHVILEYGFHSRCLLPPRRL